MKLRLKLFLTAATLVLGVVPTAALSQDGGWYIGGSGGLVNARACPSEPFPAGFTCDDTSTGWRAFFGYRFNAYFGFEVGYADLGKVTQSTAGVGSTTFEPKAVDVQLAITLPLAADFFLIGKAGIYAWDADRTTVGVGAGTINDTGTDRTWGIGAGYNLTRRLALQLEYQRYSSVGAVGTVGQSNYEVTWLTLAFKF